MSDSKTWYIYLLSNGERTYIGSTTDVRRRLRQHNGEIVGGAKSTRGKGPWELVCYISGFSGRSPACRWEKILKLRARGLHKRKWYFWLLGGRGMCPGRPTDRQYPVPRGLELYK